MQLRTASFIAFVAAIFLTANGEALADKRVALIIGNSAYKNVAKLPNPANDAAAITALFKRAGFDVVESRQNLGNLEMRRVLRDFTDKVRDADVAVVFYAGHGIELDGTNYLLPVDSALERDIDVEDEAVPLDRIVKMLDPAKRLRLVILDACRDNPFAKTMKRTSSTRSVGRGLAKVEPTSSDTLIAFAAKAGSTASDGNGDNSPFTTALVSNIATPGLDLRIAFGKVRDDVMKATNNKQEPFVYGSLGGTMVALVPPPPERVVTPTPNPVLPPGVVYSAPPSNPTADIRRDYELVREIGTKQAWEQFLSVHNVGFHADLARQQLAKLQAEEDKKAEEARKAEEAKKAKAQTPTQSTPTAPKSTEAPKASGRQIVCGSRGCQELKPGCRVEKRGSGSLFEDYMVCN